MNVLSETSREHYAVDWVGSNLDLRVNVRGIHLLNPAGNRNHARRVGARGLQPINNAGALLRRLCSGIDRS